MKFWTMMERNLGELDEILDFDGVAPRQAGRNSGL
jgi:hypothetical protein